MPAMRIKKTKLPKGTISRSKKKGSMAQKSVLKKATPIYKKTLGGIGPHEAHKDSLKHGEGVRKESIRKVTANVRKSAKKKKK